MSEIVRKMSRQELEMATVWAEKEGWNPGKYDLQAYYAIDNDSFILLTVDEDPAGLILVIEYLQNFAFLGILIVKPEYRGHGYGAKLWMEAMRRLENHPSIGLYAVPEQVWRYEASGFIIQYQNYRYELMKCEQHDINMLDLSTVTAINYEKLKLYDEFYWKFSRGNFFEELLNQTEVHAFAIYDKNTNALSGYGVIRPCVDGYRIGPFCSESLESAIALAARLISQVPNQSKIIFDIPTTNQFSSQFAEYFHCKRVPEKDTYAMFKGTVHCAFHEKCYGVASLEIG